MKIQRKKWAKLVWALLLSTDLIENLFSDEITFYLDNRKGFLWLKDEDNIIIVRIKASR